MCVRATVTSFITRCLGERVRAQALVVVVVVVVGVQVLVQTATPCPLRPACQPPAAFVSSFDPGF